MKTRPTSAAEAAAATETFSEHVERTLIASGHKRSERRRMKRNLLALCRECGVPTDCSALETLRAMEALGVAHGI